MRILVIDDSMAYLEEFSELLAGDAFADATLDHIDNALEGSQAMNRGEYDIYFVDYRLPGDNGLELIKRARDAGIDRPMICLTGFDAPQLDVQAEQSGANGFLPKGGFSAQFLSRTIRFALRSAADRQMPGSARTSLRLAQETANFGTWHWDLALDEMFWDEQMYCLHGREPSDGPPRLLWERGLDIDSMAAVERTWRDSIGTGKRFKTDFSVTWDDGSVHYIRCAGRAIRDQDGTVVRLSGINMDITELQRLVADLAQARDQAEQANQAKSRFLAAITHELRTPLHGILGSAELLCLEGELNPTQSGRLGVMINSGRHLLDTINAVLDMSQIEAGRVELQPVEVELSNLIGICLSVVRSAAEAKGLTLGLAPMEPVYLVTDPTRLRQVLINLLGNAVKFTPAGSVEVRLRQVENGAFIRMEVADTGPGVWPRHRDKLFRPFERLNAEAVKSVEGTGLGLAIAARLVQLMDGRIGYADNPGGGSVFWFELPVRDAACASVAKVAVADVAVFSPLSVPLSGRRLRVLVADDEASNLGIAKGFLSRAGHDVVCVSNGTAAVEAAKGNDFDVILLDVRMPDMNGMEATRQIRALPSPRGEVRVVAVTAQAFAQQIEMCRQAGMDGHVAKPFTQAILLAALDNTAAVPGHPARTGALPTKASFDGEQDFPEFDRVVFEDATDCLPGAELRQHLQTLIERCEALLPRLDKPGLSTHAHELAGDAHRLAGSVGMFGFLSMAAAAQRFELAANTDPAATEAFAGCLAAAIKTSMPILRQELDVATTTSAT